MTDKELAKEFFRRLGLTTESSDTMKGWTSANSWISLKLKLKDELSKDSATFVLNFDANENIVVSYLEDYIVTQNDDEWLESKSYCELVEVLGKITRLLEDYI